MAATPTAGGVMSIVDEMAENYEPSEIVKATPGLPDTSDPKQIYGAVALASQDTGLDAIAYNEMAGRPYVRGVLPWSRKNEHRPFTDVDFSHFTAYMQYKYEITKNKMEDVMKILATPENTILFWMPWMRCPTGIIPATVNASSLIT